MGGVFSNDGRSSKPCIMGEGRNLTYASQAKGVCNNVSVVVVIGVIGINMIISLKEVPFLVMLQEKHAVCIVQEG